MNGLNLRFKSNRSPQAPQKLQRSLHKMLMPSHHQKLGVITNSKALSKVYWNWACILAALVRKKKLTADIFQINLDFWIAEATVFQDALLCPFLEVKNLPPWYHNPSFLSTHFQLKTLKQKLTLPGIKPLAYTGRCLFKYSLKKPTTKPNNTLVR